ncbi:MAG: VWA domain-containing protein [Sandaracinaceae bacterium]|nr:VWA domain-containing protein [Sandaracinaceae bacterium]
MSQARWRIAIVLAVLVAGCGARTGLGADAFDAAPPALDAGIDAPPPIDAGLDAGTDARVCVPGVVVLRASPVEVVFTVDRSGSMRATFEGGSPGPGELSRWETLRMALEGPLASFDARIEAGAKFFPSRSLRPTDDDCAVFDRLDVEIGPGRGDAILSYFARFGPAGGTPIGPAVTRATDALRASSPNGEAAQFIVLATDGEPSCQVPGEPRSPLELALESVRAAHEDHGIDVFVIGIASTGPQIAVLEELARLGGRARPGGGPSYYYARDPEALDAVLGGIARDLAQCAFEVPVPPTDRDRVRVLIGGEEIRQDAARANGWDWMTPGRTQLGLFGSACDAAVAAGGRVRADIVCGR